MTDDEALERMQVALTELLARRPSVDDARDALTGDPAFALYSEWVRSFEPALVDTAAMLVARWSRRSEESDWIRSYAARIGAASDGGSPQPGS